MQHMQRLQPYDPFPFLTPPRVHAIESGVWSFTRADQEYVRDHQHLVRHMSPWHRAMLQRSLLLAQITEALSDDDFAEKCEYGIMQGVLFDRAHYCRLFKLHDALGESCVGGPRVGRQPETVRRAMKLPAPRLLFPPDAIDDGFIPPLSSINVYDIGYYVRRWQVVELYFLYQDGQLVNAMRPLGLF